MVPCGSKYELRLRGINVTPGYFGQPELTAKAFDEEGFTASATPAIFLDDADPLQGIIFAGHVVEDFKLTTGTFVHVGSLRTDASPPPRRSCMTLVAGQDRPFIGLWPGPISTLVARSLAIPTRRKKWSNTPPSSTA